MRRGNASDQQMFLAGDQGSAGGAKEMPEVRHTFQRRVQALLTGLWDVALVCTDGGCGNHPGLWEWQLQWLFTCTYASLCGDVAYRSHLENSTCTGCPLEPVCNRKGLDSLSDHQERVV